MEMSPDEFAAMSEYNGVHPIRALFDMKRSGAGITWDYFMKEALRPNMIDFIEDRDIWKFELPNTKEINEWIFSFPYDFKVWDKLVSQLESHEGEGQAILDGIAITRKKDKDIKELIGAGVVRWFIGGVNVPVINIPYIYASEALHLLADGYTEEGIYVVPPPFAASYWEDGKVRHFSLRSSAKGVDVSLIAKKYGGGGHRNAGGFDVPLGWVGDKG